MGDKTSKPQIPEIIESVAEIVANDPTVSNAAVGRALDRSRSQIGIILNKPVTRELVRAKMAQGSPIGHAKTTIASILTSLALITDSILDDGIVSDAEVSRLLQLLNALTTVIERMARAGVDLTILIDDTEDAALRHELLDAMRRGMLAAMRHPGAAARGIERIERILIPQAGPMRGTPE